MQKSLRSTYMDRSPRGAEADFSIEKYGKRTTEKEECEEQLLAEYAALLGFYIASVAVLTGAAIEQKRLPKRFGLLDVALLGIATHKLSRIIAKDTITGILRAPFVSYIRSAGAGEVEEEPTFHLAHQSLFSFCISLLLLNKTSRASDARGN